MNAHHPIFPYSVIENSPTSLTHNSVFIGTNKFKLDIETHCLIGYINIWSKLFMICIIMFLMAPYANHQYEPSFHKFQFTKSQLQQEMSLAHKSKKIMHVVNTFQTWNGRPKFCIDLVPHWLIILDEISRKSLHESLRRTRYLSEVLLACLEYLYIKLKGLYQKRNKQLVLDQLASFNVTQALNSYLVSIIVGEIQSHQPQIY